MEQSINNSLAGKLVICDGKEELRQAALTGDVLIGRAEGEGRIVLKSDCAAEKHGQIVKTENGFAYQDLESVNGTYLNDCKIGTGNLQGQGLWPLSDGDVLKIQKQTLSNAEDPGDEVVLIYRRHYVENTEWHSVDLGEEDTEIRISRHDDHAGAEEAQKTGDTQSEAEKAQNAEPDENAKGTAAKTEITAEKSAETAGDLKEHYALLQHKDSKWLLADHSTRFGVFLNNCRISAPQEIRENDVMRIGSTLFLYRGGKLWYNHREKSDNQLAINIEERSVWNLFRKKILLEDINIKVNPGEFVLILGGSGAGKTTFINAVMGYEKAKGTIMEGDIDVYKNYGRMKYEIGFVPQADLLRLEDTVYETLNNAAELKMPKGTKTEEREERIQQTLERFGLEHEKESLVEKLSGGQRKRLSIAIEFVADPWLFFLDEPDSGLDGVMARSLMENLRQIADEGRIVMAITHSPDRVADLFDKVLVLAKSEKDNVGHLTFYGYVDEAREFFETDSLEGIIKKVNRKDEGGEGLADEYIAKFAEKQ